LTELAPGMNERILAPNPEALRQRVGDQLLLLLRGETQVHRLNELAGSVFLHCDGHRPLQQVIEMTAEHFGVSVAEAAAEVGPIAEELVALALLVPAYA